MPTLEEFFWQHLAFTLEEARIALGGGRTDKTLRSLLGYHHQQGHLTRVDGVYCTVPYPLRGQPFIPDRFLVASRLRPDAVLAYHTAFELQGVANQVFTTTCYASRRARAPLEHQGVRYLCVPLPRALREGPEVGVVSIDRQGMRVRVTSPERTLAECLDRPEYAGGWEEACACIASLPFVDAEALLAYLDRRGRAILCGKVGWVLESLQERLFIPDELLAALRQRAPRHPSQVAHADRRRGHFVGGWNLSVPERWQVAVEEAAAL